MTSSRAPRPSPPLPSGRVRATGEPGLQPPPPVIVPRDVCQDYARSSQLEWLETNGLGGFAMGTVAGAATRRYHGHLVAALRPPVERHLLLSKLHEALVVDGAEHALFTAQYPDALHPQGFRTIQEFRLDPFPTWTFEAGGVRLEKRLFLVRGEDTVVVRYRVSGACRLRVGVFLAYREAHALARANGGLDGAVREEGRTVRLRPYAALPELRLHHGGARVERSGDWYYRTEYLAELERGLDFQEDLWRACALEIDLPLGGETYVAATLGERRIDPAAVEALEQGERERRRMPHADPFTARLSAAADHYLVRREDGLPTIVAGYPWFTDWGRDTMISLPGLLVARGRLHEARDVIRGFLRHLDQGLIPNRFPDRGERPEYNTADATLWLLQAVHACDRAGADPRFLREVYPAVREILAWHSRGTHHGIRVDPEDGLLVAGDAGTQLTWMDAKVGEWVVTPRHGKPVEVNALWHGALRLAERWAAGLGHQDEAVAWSAAADRVARTFEAAFWDEERGHLADVIHPEGVDRRLRPNQLLAVSLSHPLLTPARRRAVVDAVEGELLTPYGLRTLAPREAEYRPRYRGGPLERDGAYHQGAVWPWLLGPFVRARLAAHGRSPENLAMPRAGGRPRRPPRGGRTRPRFGDPRARAALPSGRRAGTGVERGDSPRGPARRSRRGGLSGGPRCASLAGVPRGGRAARPLHDRRLRPGRGPRSPGVRATRALPEPFLRRALFGLAMGATVIGIAYSPAGKRSGGHINPAITLAFLRLGKVRPRDAALYVAAQLAGASAGVLVAWATLGSRLAHPAVHFVATRPGPAGAAVAFAAEVLISFVLMSVVLAVSASRRQAWTGVCAGVLVALYITFEGPISGMSMNPARSLGSALPAGELGVLWIYFLAPSLGMLAAAGAMRRRAAPACAKLRHAPDVPCIFCGQGLTSSRSQVPTEERPRAPRTPCPR